MHLANDVSILPCLRGMDATAVGIRGIVVETTEEPSRKSVVDIARGDLDADAIHKGRSAVDLREVIHQGMALQFVDIGRDRLGIFPPALKARFGPRLSGLSFLSSRSRSRRRSPSRSITCFRRASVRKRASACLFCPSMTSVRRLGNSAASGARSRRPRMSTTASRRPAGRTDRRRRSWRQICALSTPRSVRTPDRRTRTVPRAAPHADLSDGRRPGLPLRCSCATPRSPPRPLPARGDIPAAFPAAHPPKLSAWLCVPEPRGRSGQPLSRGPFLHDRFHTHRSRSVGFANTAARHTVSNKPKVRNFGSQQMENLRSLPTQNAVCFTGPRR